MPPTPSLPQRSRRRSRALLAPEPARLAEIDLHAVWPGLVAALALHSIAPNIAPPPLHLGSEAPMTWVTPEFEVIELSSEVTSYRYHR
jgi:hypothetical protein